MAEDITNQNKIDKIEEQTERAKSLNYQDRSAKVQKELLALKEKKEKEAIIPPTKDVFLIITRDASIFDTALPAGKLIADIASLVPELHIIYIGWGEW